MIKVCLNPQQNKMHVYIYKKISFYSVKNVESNNNESQQVTL